MALFEYECEKCGLTFEKERPLGSRGIPSCPKCRSRKVSRIFTTCQVMLPATRSNPGPSACTTCSTPSRCSTCR